jgi:hypothetical protein
MTDEIPAELLDTARQFLTATVAIKLDADGLPCDRGQALEIGIASKRAAELVDPLHHATAGPARQLWTMADTWLRLTHAINGGHIEPDLGQRWLAAFAQRPDLLPDDLPFEVPDDASGLEPPSTDE